MTDDEFEALAAESDEMCRLTTNARADEILAAIDSHPAMQLLNGEVLLLGFEGNVEAVWAVPEPLPPFLRRPITQRLSPLADSTDPSFRTAEYERVGEHTYQRVRRG